MSKTPLIKELRIQPGQRILEMNPPEGYWDQLGELPEGAELAHDPKGSFDNVHLCVRNRAELERLGPLAIPSLKCDGLLWVFCPKRSSKVETDLTRDRGWGVVAEAGLRPVTQVSIDAVWSALRFRPLERVGR